MLPLVPYDPYEMDYAEKDSTGFLHLVFPKGHFCGTDKTERDVLARLLYGFRIAMTFAIGYLILTYRTGDLISFMGYLGGKYDLVGVKISRDMGVTVPFLYMVIILVSVMPGWWGWLANFILTHHHGVVFLDRNDLLCSSIRL